MVDLLTVSLSLNVAACVATSWIAWKWRVAHQALQAIDWRSRIRGTETHAVYVESDLPRRRASDHTEDMHGWDDSGVVLPASYAPNVSSEESMKC